MWNEIVFVLAFCGAVYGLIWMYRGLREEKRASEENHE
jgi:hypothetical protein